MQYRLVVPYSTKFKIVSPPVPSQGQFLNSELQIRHDKCSINILPSIELLSSDILHILGLKDKNMLCTATEVAAWCSTVLCPVYVGV
jgi:hypothetical protein